MRILALSLLSLTTACFSDSSVADFGVPDFPAHAEDAGPLVTCESYCIRPRDCAIGFIDNETCPIGFLCSSDYACTLDGGTH